MFISRLVVVFFSAQKYEPLIKCKNASVLFKNPAQFGKVQTLREKENPQGVSQGG
jgi:hypothetical protein